jgi:hypothetical protein
MENHKDNLTQEEFDSIVQPWLVDQNEVSSRLKRMPYTSYILWGLLVVLGYNIINDKNDNSQKNNTTKQVVTNDSTIGNNMIPADTQSTQQTTQVYHIPLAKRDTTYFYPQAVTIWPTTEDTSSAISDTLQWDRQSE